MTISVWLRMPGVGVTCDLSGQLSVPSRTSGGLAEVGTGKRRRTMAKASPTKVAAQQVAANRRRGGEIRILLSPGTVGSTTGFLGVLGLDPAEHVTEHYHPYFEEFL